MKKTGAYVGVTGYRRAHDMTVSHMAFCQALAVLGGKAQAQMKFMGGILVSSKTLGGSMNKYPEKYPPVSELPLLLEPDNPSLMRTIHYNTDDEKTLDEQVDQILRIAPGKIDAIQLNVRWASVAKLSRIRRRYPDLRIILQIGGSAIDDVTEPEDIHLGETLRRYDGTVDDFLVDPSGGVGKPFDVWHVFACLADDEIPRDMHPGAAGGRCAENMHEFVGLQRRLKRAVNADAEGKMFTEIPGCSIPEHSEGRKFLDVVSKVFPYVREAVSVVGNALNTYGR